MKEEILDIVNENDEIIGQKPRKEVEKKILLHRSANVIIINSKNEIFVHQRKNDRFLYPGLWDIKVGGAVKSGETYEQAALRELKEETGIQATKLQFLFDLKFRSTETNSNKKVFLVRYDGMITIQKEEIEQGRFMSIDEIEKIKEKLSKTAIAIWDIYSKENA